MMNLRPRPLTPLPLPLPRACTLEIDATGTASTVYKRVTVCNL